MAVLVRKFHDLVFNRRTVARTRRVNDAAVERGTVYIFPNHAVRIFIGVSEEAAHLVDLHAFGIRGK